MTMKTATELNPISAQLATTPIGLLKFAKLAGRNMLEVIPVETQQQLYLRGPLNIHYICDPDIITELLVGKGRHFPKAKFTKDIIGSAVGNGMILAEGQVWREQRHRYAPLFSARNLPVLSKHFARTGDAMAQTLRDTGGLVDMSQMAPEATLTNITSVMFTGASNVDPTEVREGLKRYFTYISDISLFDLMGLPSWIPRLKWFKSKAPVNNMRGLARLVIEAREAEQREVPEDFLDLMIAALREDFEDIDTTVDNLLTFVVAGHETSANALAWGLYLLAQFPEVQTELRNEVISVCPDGPIMFAEVQKMPKLQAHVKETLRLYPSAAFFARDADADVSIKGVDIAKGDALFFPVYSIHRNEQLWDDPQAYNPDRFIDTKIPRGQYIPFGDGPRICIGAQYAETEIMVLLASMLRQVEFSKSESPVPYPVLTFTMRPGGPLVLEVRPYDAGHH